MSLCSTAAACCPSQIRPQKSLRIQHDASEPASHRVAVESSSWEGSRPFARDNAKLSLNVPGPLKELLAIASDGDDVHGARLALELHDAVHELVVDHLAIAVVEQVEEGSDLADLQLHEREVLLHARLAEHGLELLQADE